MNTMYLIICKNNLLLNNLHLIDIWNFLANCFYDLEIQLIVFN